MKYKKIKICALLLVMGLTGLIAQEAIPAAGGVGSGSGGTMSYSVGQLFYSTYSGETGTVVEGVQQPFEISVVTGIEELVRFDFVSSVFPNPTVDILTILIEDKVILNLSYMLLDANGRLLQNGRITGPETRLNLRDHPAAVYFLKVTDGQIDLVTYKIIKN